jgi:uncharacterized repeat protein (TIGR03806 family)
MYAAGLIVACDGWRAQDADPYDLDFDIPRSEAFPLRLSDYGLYAEPAATLTPSADTFLYELSSELYTDQAHKQRLLRIPDGTVIGRLDGHELAYPEGTILAKTFFYPEDMGDENAPRRVLETRLLVKTEGQWNAATYLWNADQTDAILELDGATMEVSWRDQAGTAWTTQYAVPHEGECFTCHQRHDVAAYIGPSLRNLHRTVERGGAMVNQLDHLTAVGVLEPGDGSGLPSMPSDDDTRQSLETRARAYLDANCAHCHRPSGWDGASRPDLDLRFETPLDATGLVRKADDVIRQMEHGKMPYLGVTLPHDDGIELIVDFVEGL